MERRKNRETGATASPKRTIAVDDPLLTKQEAADLAGVTERWIARAVAERRFPVVKVGKLVRIRRSALEAYLEGQTLPAAEGR